MQLPEFFCFLQYLSSALHVNSLLNLLSLKYVYRALLDVLIRIEWLTKTYLNVIFIAMRNDQVAVYYIKS